MSKRFPRTLTFFGLAIGLAALAVIGCLGKEGGTGTIKGRVVYEDLTGERPGKPMQDIKIVLCRVSDDKGLPGGPVVATSNKEKVERICTIQGLPTSVSGVDGSFTLSKVPPGTYLVLYHLWPSDLVSAGTGWIDIDVTEAVMDGLGKKILTSEKKNFWEKGGLPAVMANWASGEGFTATKGSVCSSSCGFCFSLRDKGPHPIVKIQPDSTIDVVLPIYIAPKKKN